MGFKIRFRYGMAFSVYRGIVRLLHYRAPYREVTFFKLGGQ